MTRVDVATSRAVGARETALHRSSTRVPPGPTASRVATVALLEETPLLSLPEAAEAATRPPAAAATPPESPCDPALVTATTLVATTMGATVPGIRIRAAIRAVLATALPALIIRTHVGAVTTSPPPSTRPQQSSHTATAAVREQPPGSDPK